MVDVIEVTGKFSARCRCVQCFTEYSVKNRYDAKRSPVGDICASCKTAVSKMTKPTQEALNMAFAYDPDTGALTYRNTTLSGIRGEVATFDHSGGYLSVCIGRKQYLSHRVIYLMQTGKWPEHLDHINHDRQDNRWKNLRAVAQEENNRNTSKQVNSSTGAVGVSRDRRTGKYRAYISVNSKHKHLGMFDTVVAASAAREEANKVYGYHQNHGK